MARTLTELELKLRELERELMSIGRRAVDPAPQEPRSPQPPPPVRPPPPMHQQPPMHPQSLAHPQSPVHQQPPVPSTPPFAPTQPAPTPGRLVDEAVERPERRYSMDAQQTAYGEIPATRDERETIDLAELLRFKQTMQDTLQGLIGEYSRLLSLRPPSGD